MSYQYPKSLKKNRILSRNEEIEFFKRLTQLEIKFICHLFRSNVRFDKVINYLSKINDLKQDFDQLINQIESGKIKHALRFSVKIAKKHQFRQYSKTIFNVIKSDQGLFDHHWYSKLLSINLKMNLLKDEFAHLNIKLVIFNAKNLIKKCRFLEMNDIIQEGNIGLLKSIDKFDHKRGTRFMTYAMWWIRHEIVRSIQDRDKLIKVPTYRSDKLYNLNKLSDVEMINYEKNLNECDWYGINFIKTYKIISLDDQFENDDFPFYDKFLDPNHNLDHDDDLMRRELNDTLIKILAGMTPIESLVIRQRYFSEKENKLSDVAIKCNLSRERIRQIEERAIKKFRLKLRVQKHIS